MNLEDPLRCLPTTLYFVYKKAIGIIIHSYYMLRSFYDDILISHSLPFMIELIQFDEEIQPFELKDITPHPETDSLVLSQQLLVSNLIAVYCDVKDGIEIDDSRIDTISQLMLRCGDLPQPIKEFLSEKTNKVQSPYRLF